MANSEKSSKDSPEKSSEQVGVTVPDAKEMLKLFKAFDAEDLRISELPPPETFEESHKLLRGLIDKLPQRL
ncbi:MAG: hypothetical protein ABJN42_03000, partial [Roseibium sp.]|uniref:hypothetical protein n=1 Tax=Roseibium sp. TaxID=1936156 RepID=UPI00329715CF